MRTTPIALALLAACPFAAGCGKSTPTKLPAAVSIVQTSKSPAVAIPGGPSQDDVCGTYLIGGLAGTVNMVVHQDGQASKKLYTVSLTNEPKDKVENVFVPVEADPGVNRKAVETAFVDLHTKLTTK